MYKINKLVKDTNVFSLFMAYVPPPIKNPGYALARVVTNLLVYYRF